MTNTSSTIVLGLLSVAGFGASALLPQSPADAVPWKDIAGSGAVGAGLAALWMFLRFLREERQERMAERAKDSGNVQQLATQLAAQYAASTERVINQFRDTTTQLMANFREERRELLALVQRTPPHGE